MNSKIKRVAAMAMACAMCYTATAGASPVWGTIKETPTLIASAEDAKTATLTVRITDENYDPIKKAGIPVKVYDAYGNVIATGETDSDGEAVFSVPAGAVLSVATAFETEDEYINTKSQQFSMGEYSGLTFTLPILAQTPNETTLQVYIAQFDNPSAPVELAGAKILVVSAEDGTEYRATTDSTGYATFEHMPIGTYYASVEEAPAGYETTGATLTLTLKKGVTMKGGIQIREAVYKAILRVSGSDGGSVPQGDATFKGAKFGLYMDGVKYKSFTADAEGNLATIVMKDKEYEKKWTIIMETAPTGYELNKTERELKAADGTEFTSLFPKYSEASINIPMNPIKGAFRIAATPGDEIKIYLQSAGSYEKAKAGEKQTLVVDAESSTVTTPLASLPYGTYVIEDVTSGDTTTAKITKAGIVDVTFDGSKLWADAEVKFGFTSFTGLPANSGDASIKNAKYVLTKDDKEMATFTMQDIIDSKASYKVLGIDRTATWKISLVDGAGFVQNSVTLTSLKQTSSANATSFTQNLSSPTVIKGTLKIFANKDDTVRYYLASKGSYDLCSADPDCNMCGEFKTSSIGYKQITLPYGEYVVENMTTGYKAPNPKITTQGMQYLVHAEQAVEGDYEASYEIFDIFGESAGSGKYEGYDSVEAPKRESDAAYELVVTETRDGKTTTTKKNIVVSPDGKVTALPFEVFGDANGDGKFNIADAVALQSYLLNKENAITAETWRAVDMTLDGRLDAFDMVIIRQMLIAFGS